MPAAVVKLARAFRFAMDATGAMFAGMCIVVVTAGFGMWAIGPAAMWRLEAADKSTIARFPLPPGRALGDPRNPPARVALHPLNQTFPGVPCSRLRC